MTTIKLNFYYKNILSLIFIFTYFLFLDFILRPYFSTWSDISQDEIFLFLALTSLSLLSFVFFLQLILKMLVSIFQKKQVLILNEEGISLPEFYVRFWSLEMNKFVFIPYSKILFIKFTNIPNPLFQQKILSIVFQKTKGTKRINFSDNQFAKGIIDYHLAFQFLNKKVKIDLADSSLEN